MRVWRGNARQRQRNVRRLSKPRVNRRDDQGAEHGHSYDHAHHTHDGAAAVLTLLSAVLIVTHETNSVLTAYDRRTCRRRPQLNTSDARDS